MIEALASTTLFTLLLSIWPSIVAVLSTVVAAVLAIHKVKVVIDEFRSSNELKEYNANLRIYFKDNEAIRSDIKEIKALITNVHQPGWIDKKED